MSLRRRCLTCFVIWNVKTQELIWEPDGSYGVDELCWWFAYPNETDEGECRWSDAHGELEVKLPLLSLKITREELDKYLVLV